MRKFKVWHLYKTSGFISSSENRHYIYSVYTTEWIGESYEDISKCFEICKLLEKCDDEDDGYMPHLCTGLLVD